MSYKLTTVVNPFLLHTKNMNPRKTIPAVSRRFLFFGFLDRLCAMMALAIAASSQAAEKTLIDYFLPMPITVSLVSNVWGAPGVFPRDPQNGLEDTTMKQWCYWDGQIIKAADGKFHMFSIGHHVRTADHDRRRQIGRASCRERVCYPV